MDLEALDTLDTQGKLAAMERLWSSLHSEIESTEPPAWHKEILDERRRLIESGEAEYVPWSEVRHQLAARAK